tara:strand:- start:9197 stop:10147 length:951 start_codon:yes stop_codon:yes gene_type:complete
MIFEKLKIIIFLSICLVSTNVNSEIKTRIIAKVGDEIITNFDVENKIKTNLYLSGEEINQNNVDKIKSSILKSLVNLKLKRNETKKHDLKINEQAVTQYLNSITANLQISEIELINQFKFYNIDYKQFVEDIETEFLWQRLVAKIYLDRIKVNEEQINSELNKILESEKENEVNFEFNLSEIEVIFENSNEQEKLISKINDEIIKNGFKKTAIKFGTSSTAITGGGLGWIKSSQLSRETFNIVKNLKAGEVSKPLKRGNTLTFLRMNEKKVSKSNEISDVQNLRKNLENSKKNELLSLYSNSHLSKIKNITLIEFL